MSVACVRCGFPNDEDATHCRACSAPLQDASSEATIKPRLRQIIAETRARTRARQRRGVSVDPNRVDVVPRLPSGVAASDTALKTALEKGRQARLQGLREELRKGRPDVAPPARQSLPPQNLTTPPIAEPVTAKQEIQAPPIAESVTTKQEIQAPPIAESITTKQAIQAPPIAESVTAKQEIKAPPPIPVKNTDQIAEDFLDQPVKNPAKVIVPKPVVGEPTRVEKAKLSTVSDKDSVDLHPVSEPISMPVIEDQTDQPQIKQSEIPPQAVTTDHNSEQRLDAIAEPEPEIDFVEHAQAIKEANDSATRQHNEPPIAKPAAPTNLTQSTPHTQNQTVSDDPAINAEPVFKPVLSAAAKTALYRLRQTAKRLKSIGESGQSLEVENACHLYGRQRLVSTSVDSLPVLTLAILWLSTQLSSGQRPPEEIVASWLLGESGGTPWGLLLVGIFWLVWCWAGIIVWGVTPGMKIAKLNWHTHNRWKRFARPPLFLISLIPLGLGGTYALLDKNSRGLSDIILRLTWYRSS